MKIEVNSLDNKKIKDFAKYYNNRFLKFFNERLRSKPKKNKIANSARKKLIPT